MTQDRAKRFTERQRETEEERDDRKETLWNKKLRLANPKLHKAWAFFILDAVLYEDDTE